MIITCPRLSCLTLPIVVSFVTCLFIALLDVFCLRVIHSCIFVSCISQRLGFPKKGLIVWCIFFFGWKGLGTGRNWVHILGIWGLFKLVNIRWFFYVLFIYISGLFHYYRYGWRVLSLHFFFADFSFDRLLEGKKKKQNKSFVVCCFDSQNIHTCTAVSMFPLLYLLDKSSSPPLQLPPSSTTQLMPYCF